MSFISELSRRNVFRIAATYVIASWIITQVVSTLEAPLNLPDWFDTVVVVLLGLGFPIALLIAWAFELTPDGIKASRPAEPGATKNPQTIDYAMVVALVLVTAVTLWDRTSQPTDNDSLVTNVAEISMPVDKSIAVLPFADMSPAGDQEYFGDGIAEEILNELAALEGLRVASRTSSFSYKNIPATVSEIGESLNVSLVLEGSVRTDANRLRITAQLIDAATGYHHWSETYDRELDDIFAIQEEISSSLAGVLGVTLNVGDVNSFAGAGTDSFEAYSYYLQALDLPMNQRQGLLQQAIELDPDYAAAISGLGMSIASSMWTNPVEQAPALVDRSIEFLNRAIEISPDSANAYALQATANYARLTFLESEENYARAMSIDPDGRYEVGYSNFLMRTGRSTESVRYDNLAYENELTGSNWLQSYARMALEDFDTAQEIISAATIIDAARLRYLLALNRKDIEAIHAAVNSLSNVYPLRGIFLSRFMENIESPENALNMLRSTLSDEAEVWPEKYTDIALLAAFHGDHLLALESFSIEARLTTVRYGTMWLPIMSGARRLPAFKELVEEVNLVEYWEAYGWSDFCRPIGSDDFECQ